MRMVSEAIAAIRTDIDIASQTLLRDNPSPNIYDGAFYVCKGYPQLSFSVYMNRETGMRYLLVSIYE